MKAHTSDFKTNIAKFGRELDSKITYTISGTTTELGNEQLNSVSPHYEGAILKSVMKQLDIDSNIEIPVGTELNYQFGVKTRSGKNLFNNVYQQGGLDLGGSGGEGPRNDRIRSEFVKVEPNTTYTVSNNNANIDNFGVGLYKADKSYDSSHKINGGGWNDFPYNFTTQSDTQYVRLSFRKSDNSNITPNGNYEIQIEKGNIATTYEAYGMYDYVDYGNYIVKEVEKQEDTRSWKITCYDKMLYAMKEYEKIKGKNLFDKNANIVNNYYINATGGVASDNNLFYQDQFIKVEPSNLYTISSNSSQIYRIAEYDTTETFIQRTYNANASTEWSFTTASNTAYIKMAGAPKTTIDSLQIEKGQATDYKAYFNYPTTIRNYLSAICYDIGVIFANETEQFANYDKIITSELYLDTEGRSMNYTYRDVLDELAQVTASTICINSNDELEIRYIHDVGEITNVSNSSIYLNNSKQGELSSFELEGKTTQASTPTPSSPSKLFSVGYENLFEPVKSINGTNIAMVNGTVSIEGDTFKLTRTGDADLYFGQVVATGNTYTAYAGVLIDVSNVSAVYYYVSNPLFIKNIITRYDANKVSLGYTGLNASKGIFTIPNGTKYISFRFGYANAVLGTTYDIKAMICASSQTMSYIPYGKYGIEVKSTGKNLFDKNNANVINGYLSGSMKIVSANDDRVVYIPCKANTTYTVSKMVEATTSNNRFSLGTTTTLPQANTTLVDFVYLSNGTTQTSFSITTGNTAKYLVCGIYHIDSSTTFDDMKASIQIEEGSTATTYEQYTSNTKLYLLDSPLRAIGNVKDKLYIENGYLYVERKIGSVVLDGTESDWGVNGSSHVLYRPISNKKQAKSGLLSNYYKYTANDWSQAENNTISEQQNNNYIFIKNNDFSSVNNFKTWLGTHNTEVQYILAEPYIEELGAVNMPITYDGVTYVDTSDIQTPTMNVSYISGFDEINEEYLKDVNVNFGEKFGAVNTIVLSRGGDGDKITLSQPTNLADDDKVAIQITDNQIMNDNDRDQYMPDILHQLYGLEYYINDFTSTGVCYYDLCDRYRVKIDNNSYKCIMFNDNVEITQGLKEDIYTDMQEENEQEYKYMSSTDRGITQANIIAKKNEAEILEFTQRLNSTNNRINAVETKQTDTDRTINILSTNIDDNGNITEVTTTTGFKFNADGMTISDSNTNFSALHRNTGTYYYDGSTVVGQYTKEGSKQKDLSLFGVYYYGMDKIDDTPMFVAQLYHDENGEECFGHFYNRGD